MAKNTNNLAKDVVWDLSSLYNGTSDPAIEKDKAQVAQRAKVFSAKYKGKIAECSSAELVSALTEYEAIIEISASYQVFASLLFAKDTLNEKIAHFNQEAQEFGNQINASLLWFRLELTLVPESRFKKWLTEPKLAKYQHYLEHARAFKPFQLSEKEEVIITKKDQSGSQAFVRFYDEVSTAEKYKLGKKVLTYSQIAAIAKDDPDTKKRKAATAAVSETLIRQKKFYTFVLNSLLLDKKTEDEIRGYKYPQEATFLSYEVKPKTVEALVKTVEDNYLLCEKYYKTKSKLLNRRLYEWDRYSSIFSKKNKKISWGSAKEIILTSFSEFDAEFAKLAQMFFDKGWVDAELAPGKLGGAFCNYAVSSKNPFVLINFTGQIEDVMTLAHELGHGIHAYLSRGNTTLNYWPSTATAEIASIFAESIVFDYLYTNTEDVEDKINLLANKIQGSFATIFRQVAFYQFESDIHSHRKEKGELTTDQINEYYLKRLTKTFGKGLTLTENHRYWWMPVLHFYHYNFYVFTYAFGEALTLALYNNYKSSGKKFITKYKNALRLGGSKDPYQITSNMGVDINNPDFWQNGINLLANYTKEFKKLTEQTAR